MSKLVPIVTSSGVTVRLNPTFVEAIHDGPKKGAPGQMLSVVDMNSGACWHVDGSQAEVEGFLFEGKPQKPPAPKTAKDIVAELTNPKKARKKDR